MTIVQNSTLLSHKNSGKNSTPSEDGRDLQSLNLSSYLNQLQSLQKLGFVGQDHCFSKYSPCT